MRRYSSVIPFDSALSEEEGSRLSNEHYEKKVLDTLRDNTKLVHFLTIIENYYSDPSNPFPYELYSLGGERLNITTAVQAVVHELYTIFLCFRSLVWDDSKAYDLLISRFLIPHNAAGEPFESYAIYEDPAQTCWAYLQKRLGSFGDGAASIEYRMKLQNGKIEEFLFAHSLADALLLQLYMHISLGADGTYSKYKLESCELCHEQFVKKHGNSRFCENCAKNNVRVASHRNKKKKGV